MQKLVYIIISVDYALDSFNSWLFAQNYPYYFIHYHLVFIVKSFRHCKFQMNDDFVAIFYQHLENVKTSVFKNHLQREYDAKSTCSYVMQILV